MRTYFFEGLQSDGTLGFISFSGLEPDRAEELMASLPAPAGGWGSVGSLPLLLSPFLPAWKLWRKLRHNLGLPQATPRFFGDQAAPSPPPLVSFVRQMVADNWKHKGKGYRIGSMSLTEIAEHLVEEAEEFLHACREETLEHQKQELADVRGCFLHALVQLGMTEPEADALCFGKLQARFEQPFAAYFGGNSPESPERKAVSSLSAAIAKARGQEPPSPPQMFA